MATIGDYIFLAICLTILGAIIYGVRGSSINESVEKQHRLMKDKGFDFSSDGLRVKTDRVKMSRDDEVTNTQASFNRSGEMLKKHKDAFSFNAGKGYTEPSK